MVKEGKEKMSMKEEARAEKKEEKKGVKKGKRKGDVMLGGRAVEERVKRAKRVNVEREGIGLPWCWAGHLVITLEPMGE